MGTTELPVFPQQEAQDQKRKWNIRFQQELTFVLVTRSRDRDKKLDHQHLNIILHQQHLSPDFN